MKVLITGVCGFVGSVLARSLIEHSPAIEVHGFDNLSRPGSEQNRRALLQMGVHFRHGDLRQVSDVESLPAVDWVIDGAANPTVMAGVDGATSSRQIIEHNLFGTVNLLEYCKAHGAGFLLLSTSRVHSIAPLAGLEFEVAHKAFRPVAGQVFPSGITVEGVAEHYSTSPPLSFYGATKQSSETLALEYSQAFGFPVWINRCGVMAGAGQFGRGDQGIFSFWINAWRSKEPLRYIGFGGKGWQVRDGFHPRELMPLILQQMADPMRPGPRVFNLGGGLDNALSLAQLSGWSQERFGRRRLGSVAEERPYDLPWVVMDSTLAKRHWNWAVKTPLLKVLDEIATHAEAHPDWSRWAVDSVTARRRKPRGG